ncbi:MAG: thiamine pyrophosphate-requiring protein [Rhodospirillales bacterium]|nr:thiamine pyrophosphate-requiring protein [Rhodospirillales bacterium]
MTTPAPVASPGRIAAEDYLDALAAQGIDHLFCNPGTDFAPIVEAYARAARSNRRVPKPMVIPHENAAVCMAHGVTMVTGRPQAVMTHTNVGTANAINALIDAARDRIPMLLSSGRTPVMESGPSGARNVYIHWAQEMFDQAGMLREMVKWDYELRRPDQIDEVVSRAMELATASPSGPVYLSLPREVLGEAVEAPGAVSHPARARPAPPAPAAAEVAMLADWIAAARMPLIVTAALGRDKREFAALARLAERFALPVVPFNPRYHAMSSRHPMYQGANPGPLLAEADLVLVWDTDVPWYPGTHRLADGARVVQIGEDPLYARYPMRSFRSDLTLRCANLPLLEALEPALAARAPDVSARRTALTARSEGLRAGWAAEAERDGAGPVCTMAWLNHCLRGIVDAETIMVSEYSFRQDHCPLDHSGALFGLSPAGGLGWGLGAALGAKLAAPEKQVIAVLGDGAYMFANPTACHFAARAHGLPVLAVIYNNGIYGAVRRSTLDMYPDSAAAAEDGQRLADLAPSPDFEQVMAAHGGHGERVERPGDLPAALARAAAAVRAGRQAVVNVLCPGGGSGGMSERRSA